MFWQANAFDARNQVTQEALGNGLLTTRAYDAVTGWLETMETGIGASVQDLEYEWDLVGNLKKRIDHNQSDLTEEFFYDNLYRLKNSTLTGVSGFNIELDYDLLGNITSKTGVGSYGFHSTKKHRAISAGGMSLGYDANGNVESRGATTLEWTSYNYPKCIRTGSACSGTSSNWSTFSYTPDRQYWKQVSNYTAGGESSTYYIGGLLEKVQNSAGTDYRHMIRAGGTAIIVSRKSSGTNSVHYVTGDHLGSSSAITDSSGNILVNSSFEAFGRRRGANWAGTPSSGDWNAIAGTTRRGYTDHSMLDNLGLIHMNGRVQDPVLGRFLSADPHIPNPMSTQSYNRYSYVQNNPLTMIDPSGFGESYPCEKTYAGDYSIKTYCWRESFPEGGGGSFWHDRGPPADGARDPVDDPTNDSNGGLTVTPSDSIAPWSGIGFAPGDEGSIQAVEDWICSIGISACDRQIFVGAAGPAGGIGTAARAAAAWEASRRLIKKALAYERAAPKRQARAQARYSAQILQVRQALDRIKQKGLAELAVGNLSNCEMTAAAECESLKRAMLGIAIHRAVARELGGGWTYKPTASYDYLQRATGAKIELTTDNLIGIKIHVLRNPDVPVVTYDPDDFLE